MGNKPNETSRLQEDNRGNNNIEEAIEQAIMRQTQSIQELTQAINNLNAAINKKTTM